MKLILLAQVFSTLFMVGLIWFVQIVHYPLYANVGREQFPEYEALHNRRTNWVVGPAMLIEMVTAAMLLKYSPHASSHHIQRLMVLGNFAQLWGAHPRLFHAWHMAMYLDAIDWASLPNTLGMSQYGTAASSARSRTVPAAITSTR